MDFKHLISGLIGMVLALGISFAAKQGYDINPCQPQAQQSPAPQSSPK